MELILGQRGEYDQIDGIADERDLALKPSGKRLLVPYPDRHPERSKEATPSASGSGGAGPSHPEPEGGKQSYDGLGA